MNPGTLYPTLHKLEQDHLVKSLSEKLQGKVRKYYKITPKGNRMLAEAKERIDILVREIDE